MLNRRRVSLLQAALMLLGVLLAGTALFFFRLGFLFLDSPADTSAAENRMVLLTVFGIGLIPAILSTLAFIGAFRVRMPAGRCVECGYDLRGAQGPCRECGHITSGA